MTLGEIDPSLSIKVNPNWLNTNPHPFALASVWISGEHFILGQGTEMRHCRGASEKEFFFKSKELQSTVLLMRGEPVFEKADMVKSKEERERELEIGSR